MTSKKKKRIICITCGVVAALCVLAYTQSVRISADNARAEALARYGGEQLEVCVATKDIAAGETIDSTSITTKMWVADLLPEDAVRNANDIIGKQATTSILNGEVISNKRFNELPITLEVPSGLTAVSVPAKDVSSVGGALSAGMKIDVYSTGNTSTFLIAQNVLVLATSATVHESSSASVTWVTLAVEPQSVQEIVAAAQNSSLYFVLPSGEAGSGSDSSSNYSGASGVDANGNVPATNNNGGQSNTNNNNGDASAQNDGNTPAQNQDEGAKNE